MFRGTHVIYNFRNKRYEEIFEQTGIVSKGVPSINKASTVDYIVQIIGNEH